MLRTIVIAAVGGVLGFAAAHSFTAVAAAPAAPIAASAAQIDAGKAVVFIVSSSTVAACLYIAGTGAPTCSPKGNLP